jgi:hypothetical protein
LALVSGAAHRAVSRTTAQGAVAASGKGRLPWRAIRFDAADVRRKLSCGRGKFQRQETEEGSDMKSLVTIAAAAAVGLALVGAAAAQATQGPPKAPKDNNDSTWGCEAEAGLPPEHCINLKSQGKIGNIKVFFPDGRWPQEGISFDSSVDNLPCLNDPGSPDGTWWEVLPGVWVCHHKK